MGMKKILILGGAGMLGHKLCQRYKDRYEVWATVRAPVNSYKKYDIFCEDTIISGLDISNMDKVIRILCDIRPDVVINCVGVIKQLKSAKDPIATLKINSLFPHQLANMCQAIKARMIHISTDCVFAGTKGMYSESDVSDATDLYGRTKYLGEVDRTPALTIRTSIIGRELQTTSGLIEWFLSNRDSTVKGFQKAIYTGFTTIALADVIANIIDNHPELTGLYQVSSEPINKYDLLCIVKEKFGLKTVIEPEIETCIDRSLDSSRFRQLTGFIPPSWDSMINQMAEDPTPYGNWKSDT